jgi:dTDP-glucose pyrophosphorylase
MINFKSTFLSPSASIRDTMKCIDKNAFQIAIVVNNEHHLLGIVTDGDIRRGIIRGVSLEDPVEDVMNISPKVTVEGEDLIVLRRRMEKLNIHHLIKVDENNKVIDLILHDDLVKVVRHDNWVVIMAGGLGSRLHPLTVDTPKPMLKIGDKPILETIIDGFILSGYRNFYISINYKGEMVEEYFKDGSKWDINIKYIYENKPLKTAGALSILPEIPTEDIIVINGDILTKLNFSKLLKFHKSEDSFATMCVRKHRIVVPFGVIETEESSISSITEKPTYDFMVNAGIYVISPDTLKFLKKGEPLDMPDLFRFLNDNAKKTVAFPLSDYWIDVGSHQDFEKAQTEFGQKM